VRGDHHDGCVAKLVAGTNGVHDGMAIHLRHQEIQQDEIWTPLERGRDCRPPVVGDDDVGASHQRSHHSGQ
jgi:hypothetical protein